MKNKGQSKALIARYQQSIFALVLYLIGGDQDAAYNICATSFAEALSRSSSLEQEEAFLTRLIDTAIKKTRATKTIPVSDELEFLDVPLAEKGPLRVVLKAFQILDFDEKALLLLRDQLNLSYRNIASSMRISESSAKQKIIQARIQFREKLEETVNDG